MYRNCMFTQKKLLKWGKYGQYFNSTYTSRNEKIQKTKQSNMPDTVGNSLHHVDIKFGVSDRLRYCSLRVRSVNTHTIFPNAIIVIDILVS